MESMMFTFVFCFILIPLSLADSYSREGSNPCYDEHGKSQRCVPDFVNAAFNILVHVTNTCGQTGPTHYCTQTGILMSKTCDICDNRIPDKRHWAQALTDFNNPPNETWWQSETMMEGIQYPNEVNLTLVLGKSFDITYVRLKFRSPRPESFAIYKKSRPDDVFLPWQYYSASCRATFSMPESSPILPGAVNVATCSKEFSDISPLTGGNVVFSTLEGRPHADKFEESPKLQDWVAANEIRVVLQRLNTFGDERFHDEKVLKSYYYAISDFAVGGRCKCNGHASECVKSTGGGVERLVCRCEHNAMGEDCEQCAPFYNDRPWKPATSIDANECKACECNGLASRCYFDDEMFAKNGSGGHCIDCTGNTRGVHCEQCIENHWNRPGEKHCIPCNCDETGSSSLQCDENGQCPCKPGVSGLYCDRCEAGFYEFNQQGCKDCHCDEAGSFGNQPNCRADTGDCSCKSNVEGKQCNLCKPGHFSLSVDNQFGCTPCFCFGHSSVCDTAQKYYQTNITSEFARGSNSWKATAGNGLLQVGHDEHNEVITVSGHSARGETVYFVAPFSFLGDIRNSYNQYLIFTLKVKEQGARASVRDIIIEGANGQELSLPIFAQENPVPAEYEQTYKFRIHEDSSFGWNPRLNSLDFLSILANVTAFKIRGTFTPYDEGSLRRVDLQSASKEPQDGSTEIASWVESCTCLEGFVGQFCETCAPGYRREHRYGGPFNRCVKCECHGHTELCEAESGRCICEHNTAGDTCERCARGFYGNALQGTDKDCQECPCPENGPCILHTDGDIICLNCPLGYSGRRCDACADGYYGQPGEGKECKKCECSGNIDDNSVGNCDQITGECKKCIFNSYGFHCEKCLPGFWGDALLDPKGDCKSCDCYSPATSKPSVDYDVLECEQQDGQCSCLPHATGQRCDQCQSGYYNLTSGAGCQSCSCDLLGSTNITCDITTGQCQCKPGVTGKRCDQCIARYFGFSAKGCQGCDCEIIGAESLQCDVDNGQCQCRVNIEGRRCDRCIENMYDLQGGCRKCEECYTLIQKRVNDHRMELKKLEEVLKEIIENPVTVNDTDFDHKLDEVKELVKKLAKNVKDNLADDDSSLVNQIESLRKDLDQAKKLVDSVDEIIKKSNKTAEKTDMIVERWNRIKDGAYADLERARQYLDTEGRDAWERAKKASEEYGAQSEKLSKIAQEARKLADKHEEQSNSIEEYAHEAVNKSKKSLAAAQEAIFGGEETSREIEKLKTEYSAAQDLYNQTKQMAQEQSQLATETNTNAAKTLTEVDALEIPDVDSEDLKQRAKEIQEEAKMAEENAQTEATKNKAVVDESQAAVVDAKYALDQARGAQQQADSVLADVEVARNKAQEAVKLAEDTLKEANQTLHTLMEFDRLVEESKKRAVEELGKIPEIEKLIEEAENKTKEAEKALGNAKADAASAEEIAQRAQEEAEAASKAATDIREKAEKTKQDAQNVKNEVEELQKDIEAAHENINNYKTLAAEDEAKAAEAAGEAAQAERSANKTNVTVNDALEKVKRILDELKSLDDINDSDLDELEKQLDEATKALDEANLEQAVDSLKEKQSGQQRKINAYKADIDKLQKEVENIEQIKDSLPNECFNLVKLEETRR